MNYKENTVYFFIDHGYKEYLIKVNKTWYYLTPNHDAWLLALSIHPGKRKDYEFYKASEIEVEYYNLLNKPIARTLQEYEEQRVLDTLRNYNE